MDRSFWARRMPVRRDGGKIRLYLRQIPQGMANLHQIALFVSQITALTRKPTQYPARERRLKLVQVLRFNSIPRITGGSFMTTIYNSPIFGYSRQKASFSKMNAICFMAARLCDRDYTALTQAGDGFVLRPLMICKA
jgi:hypothetical protein